MANPALMVAEPLSTTTAGGAPSSIIFLVLFWELQLARLRMQNYDGRWRRNNSRKAGLVAISGSGTQTTHLETTGCERNHHGHHSVLGMEKNSSC